MTDRIESPLEQVTGFLRSTATVTLAQVRAWIAEGDDEVLGATVEALWRHARRIEPSPEPTLIVDVLLRIIRAGVVRPDRGEFSLSPYDASRWLLGVTGQWNAESGRDPSAGRGLEYLCDRVAAEYRAGDEVVRRRIVDGFLEHAFESAPLRELFEGWRTEPTLSQAYAEAALWADHQ